MSEVCDRCARTLAPASEGLEDASANCKRYLGFGGGMTCYRLGYEREKARAAEARALADDWKATAEHLHTAMRRLIASLPNHLVSDAERALGTNPATASGAAAPGCSEEGRCAAAKDGHRCRNRAEHVGEHQASLHYHGPIATELITWPAEPARSVTVPAPSSISSDRDPTGGAE